MLNIHHYGPADASPVIALHGVTGHGERFAGTAAAALPDRHVLAVDLRGHGRSTEDAPWTIERHVADVIEVMAAYGIDRAPVLGHSFGGAIATHLLAIAPRRVERLALLDPAIALPGAGMAGVCRDLMRDEGYDSLDALIEARRAGLAPEGVPFSDDDARVSGALCDDGKWRRRFSPPVAIAAWSEMTRPMPALPTPVPTMLVACGRAGIVGDAQLAHYRSQLGDALEVVTIDCGHMLYWERFDETAALVRRFFA